jgi:glutathione synthase/RimK-type ligase-like ATP-grasp enzyme
MRDTIPNLFHAYDAPMANTRKKESLILGPLLKKIGREIGATVLIEPEWGVVGQITFKNGKKSYFRYNTVDLNPVGASDIAKDKDYAAFFMKTMGYPVPHGRAFCSPEWAQAIGSKKDTRAARVYAKQIGYPVIVKPNSGSQGSGVALAHTDAQLVRALRVVFQNDKIALVQKPVSGRDYRIVVLDGTIISAYERIPLNVMGDGKSSILRLLRKKQRMFVATNRDTWIKSDDPRISAKLRAQKLRMSSILPIGKQVFLLDNANLSTGGDAFDVTKVIHSSFAKIAARLTRDMGLRLCGVDIITADITKAAKKYCVLEINAGPGLDHYVQSGPEQRKLVEDMYRRVLLSLSR